MLRPLIHFFLLASLGFALSLWWPTGLTLLPDAAPRAGREPLALSDERISQLTGEWISVYGSAPSEIEMRVLVSNALDDEALYREAVRLDLHRTDPVAKRRLAQNMSFLMNTEDVESEDDEERVRQALELGMHRSDLVIRRRLIQRMQSALEARALEPSEEDCRRYVDTHPEAFSSPRRYRIAHAYDSHRGSTPKGAAADEAGEALELPKQASVEFPYSGLYTRKEIDRDFGHEVASVITTLERGSSAGPISGVRGRYWVRVDEVIPPMLHPFEQIRDRAMHDIMVERRRRARAEGMAEIRGRYALQSPPATPIDLPDVSSGALQ
jgi:hypothetical protein